jgi:hypothetical protein
MIVVIKVIVIRILIVIVVNFVEIWVLNLIYWGAEDYNHENALINQLLVSRVEDILFLNIKPDVWMD